MKNFKFILIVLIYTYTQNVYSQSNNCDKVLNKEINLQDTGIEKSDLELLKKCGYNLEKFSTNVISLSLGDIVSKGETLTYLNLINRSEEINSKLEKQHKNQMILSFFKFGFITLIISALFYWVYIFTRKKLPENKDS